MKKLLLGLILCSSTAYIATSGVGSPQRWFAAAQRAKQEGGKAGMINYVRQHSGHFSNDMLEKLGINRSELNFAQKVIELYEDASRRFAGNPRELIFWMRSKLDTLERELNAASGSMMAASHSSQQLGRLGDKSKKKKSPKQKRSARKKA